MRVATIILVLFSIGCSGLGTPFREAPWQGPQTVLLEWDRDPDGLGGLIVQAAKIIEGKEAPNFELVEVYVPPGALADKVMSIPIGHHVEFGAVPFSRFAADRAEDHGPPPRGWVPTILRADRALRFKQTMENLNECDDNSNC